MSKTSEAIIGLRTEKGLTQQDLADTLLVSRSLVSLWELGIRTPDQLSVENMAELFGVEANAIVPDSRYVFAAGNDPVSLDDELELFTDPGTIPLDSPEKMTAVIEVFLQKLSRKDRELFMSRFLLMKTYKTIADEFGMNESTVRSKMSRMLNKFKLLLSTEETR